MKNVKTTTIKMRHRTVALLLLILIAFSSASCNIEGELSVTESDTQKVIDSPQEKTEEQTEESTESNEEYGAVEYDKKMEEEIQLQYYVKIVKAAPSYVKPSHYTVDFIAKFGEKYIVYVNDGSRNRNMSAVDIGGYEFRYYKDNDIYLYEDLNFCTLNEAIDTGKITDKELEITHLRYKEYFSDYYKRYSIATIEDDFSTALINVDIQPYYNDKIYTPEDFPELSGVLRVEELNFVKHEGHIAKFLRVYLDNYTKDDILDAVSKLKEREDFICVDVSYRGIVDGEMTATGSLNDAQWAHEAISLYDAWGVTGGSSNIKVAIIKLSFGI